MLRLPEYIYLIFCCVFALVEYHLGQMFEESIKYLFMVDSEWLLISLICCVSFLVIYYDYLNWCKSEWGLYASESRLSRLWAPRCWSWGWPEKNQLCRSERRHVGTLPHAAATPRLPKHDAHIGHPASGASRQEPRQRRSVWVLPTWSQSSGLHETTRGLSDNLEDEFNIIRT